ncbi:hypothetical protein GUITHDRAFT_142152 [Guillardia theta CCMP2712]|uniref:Uncharacterized protein n=1 Tax=Guillardia theta (strain CCMP2712) TaxID=905079 RepID=L1IY82_GUITC|nr:hypothetical protein GUITHDRAFT_142152 [Guillardia theta CCMP2712]EKX41233.1 hypothetical protein GUITHDRAFT_142152 [Guillardia theta CCMP2712]|eukprot:XP_005828213.1 hypothetical protein GUITHDRAFT_142152 [Guillardia theta CCMP2712]
MSYQTDRGMVMQDTRSAEDSTSRTSFTDVSHMSTDMLQQQLTHHVILRMHERDINFDLIRETVRRGWRRDFAAAVLYVSDHITVVTSGKRLITAWRNELTSFWPLLRAADGADGLTADTAYAFVQDKDKIMFAGVLDISGDGAEIGFGLHRLGASHEESYFDAMVVGLERQAPPRARRERLRLERIVERGQRDDQVFKEERWRDMDDQLLHRLADEMSHASTNDHHERPGRGVKLSVGGIVGPDVMIQRRLCSDEADARSWVKFGKGEDFPLPHAGFGRLVELMQVTVSCLPEVAGRWTYRDAKYEGKSSSYKYTILPLNKLQQGNNISFHVVCLHSDDDDDNEQAVYRRIGVGRGSLRLDSTGRARAWDADRSPQEGDVERRRQAPPRYHRHRARQRSCARKEGRRLDCPDSDPEDFERMMEAFVPLQPGWEEAIQCGEIDRIEQLLREDSSLLRQPLRVDKILNSPRLNSRNGFPVLPVVAAALYRRFDVVEALLPHYRAAGIELDAFVLAVLSGSEAAREQLGERARRHPRLLTERCPESAFIGGRRGPHPLSAARPDEDLRLVGCRLIEIAAKFLLTDTVQLLLSLGSAHTPVSALQAGDVEEVRRFLRTARGPSPVNDHFDGRRNAAMANIDSMTPLLYAVYRSDVAMVRMLIEEGADIFVRRGGQQSTSINYAQIYDRDVQQGFPVLRLLLEEYRRRRREGTCPPDWLNLKEKCEKWQHNTLPEAQALLIEYDLDDEEAAGLQICEEWQYNTPPEAQYILIEYDFDDGEDSDEEVEEAAAGLQNISVE